MFRRGLQTPLPLRSTLARPFAQRPSAVCARSFSAAPVDTHASDEPHPLFDKILIANRGEIACRVIKTAKRMGIKTVAIYSQVEAQARHVELADEAFCVGPAPSSQSYLQIDRIIDIMKKTGAQAVHPGYGFLSENADFAEAVEAIGASFIGPPSNAIHAMGDKIESKQIAIDAEVNTIPGFQGVIQDEAEAVQVAQSIGYPVMIKASAGGGGKGMRIAYNDAEAKEGFRLSTEEARSSFGDDRIFIEKFIEEPHHIEIQLIADKHGKVVCFPERECSIQRRNQKVLEESPSALLTPETRAKMCEQAAMLAKAVGYNSAGTVEFLADKEQNFYFLEMNTRLQVEHPVTEYVGGVDLVEHMIKVAAGEKIPESLTTEGVTTDIKGWALEARVYAEDPLRNFLPSNGSLLDYQVPPGSTAFDRESNVRVDSGLMEGMEISTHYDPMIAKLVTFGDTREACIDTMQDALNQYVIRGTPNFAHNAGFLSELCRSPRFRRAETPTSFIAEEYPDGFRGVKLSGQEMRCAAVVGSLLHAERSRRSFLRGASGMQQLRNAMGGGMMEEEDTLEGRVQIVTVKDDIPGQGETANTTTSYSVVIDADQDPTEALTLTVTECTPEGEQVGEPVQVPLSDWSWDTESPLLETTLEQQPYVVQYHGPVGATNYCSYTLQVEGASLVVTVKSPREAALSKDLLPPEVIDLSNMIVSPMPGLLVSVAVEDGQRVEVGQEIAVVEAMKMQNVLRAPRAGVISKVQAKAGDSLDVDQIIASMEDEA